MAETTVQHLLVGVSAYRDAALELPAGTAHNVDGIREAFISSYGRTVADGTAYTACRVVEAGEPAALLEEVASAAKRRPLVLYWSGHAAVSREGDLSLALPHSRADDLATWLSASALIESMAQQDHDGCGRLLILDVCLGAGHAAAGGRVVDIPAVVSGMARPGVAVWAGIGRAAAGFAANSRDASVFTHVLTQLLHHAAASAEPLRLERAHACLARVLQDAGYPAPWLHNAPAFQASLTQEAGPTYRRGRAARELVRRAVGRLVRSDMRRYALVCGMTRWGAGEDAASPHGHAQSLYERLLASGWGFTRDTTTVLGAVTRQELRSRIKDLADSGQNLVLVYLLGAGEVSRDRDIFDLKVAVAGAQSIAVSELVDVLRTSAAERVTLLIDAYDAQAEAVAHHLTTTVRGTHWDSALGTSRLVVTWASSKPTAGPDPLALTAQGQFVPTDDGWGALLYPAAARRETHAWSPAWRFSFPGAEIRWLADAGPLAAWHALLTDAASPSAESSVAQWLLSSGSGGAPKTSSLAAPIPTPPYGLADTASNSSSAHLTVVGGTYPVRAGAEVQLAFAYRPHVSGTVPVCGDDPLDVTVVAAADDAVADPPLFHSCVTRDGGTPTHDITLIPRAHKPVTLQLSVLRRTDGALLQELTTVLPAAAPENAALS